MESFLLAYDGRTEASWSEDPLEVAEKEVHSCQQTPSRTNRNRLRFPKMGFTTVELARIGSLAKNKSFISNGRRRQALVANGNAFAR